MSACRRSVRCARAAGAVRLVALLAAVAATGCATTPVLAPATTTFDARRIARARELAPDLYGRAERARREASVAEGAAAREAARVRAELWLEAALVEAERIEQQRAAGAAEARAARADAERLRAVNERSAIERERALAAASRAAKARALRMLAGGALADAARGGDAATVADATRFALERGAALLAAAIAMGLPEAQASVLGARLASLSAQPDARPRLRAAIALLEDLELALGAARLRHPGPSPEERACLLADAAERGLAIELGARGAVLALAEDAFPARGSDASASGARTLAQLAALRRLHPRGPLEIEAGSSQLAARRARALAARLRGLRTDVRIAQAPAQGPSVDTPGLLLPAYAAP